MALFETAQDKQDILDLMESFSRNNLFEIEVVIGEKEIPKNESKMRIRMIRASER